MFRFTKSVQYNQLLTIHVAGWGLMLMGQMMWEMLIEMRLFVLASLMLAQILVGNFIVMMTIYLMAIKIAHEELYERSRMTPIKIKAFRWPLRRCHARATTT
jgi:hypothetical protein